VGSQPCHPWKHDSPAARKRRGLYRRLCQAAAAGEPCPSNRVLGDVAGYASVDSVGWSLAILDAEGLIKREQRGSKRIITICETGARTADIFSSEPVLVRPKRPVRQIADTVIEFTGSSRKDVLGRSRFREHVVPRQLIFALSIREGWTSTHVGRTLGFDHSTVLHARDVVPRRAEAEPALASTLRDLAAQLPPLPERWVA
jgi:hypothetical protein